MFAFMKFVWHSHYITTFLVCKPLFAKNGVFGQTGFLSFGHKNVIKQSNAGHKKGVLYRGQHLS